MTIDYFRKNPDLKQSELQIIYLLKILNYCTDMFFLYLRFIKSKVLYLYNNKNRKR